MKTIAIIMAALLAAPPAFAVPGCHFKGADAIICATGHNAVDAFDIYGFDANRMMQSYSRAALHQAGCFIAGSKVHIRQLDHGRVAYVNGWRSVTVVDVNGVEIGDVADEYIAGRCERYVPEVIDGNRLAHLRR